MSEFPPPPPPPSQLGYPTGPPMAPPGGAPPRPDPDGDDWAEEPSGPRGRRVSIVLAIVAVLALLAATIVVVTRDGDEPDEATGPTSEPDDTGVDEVPPSTAPEVEGPPLSKAELEVLVEDLQAYVAEARGLEFLHDVEVELASGEAFESRLLEDFEDEADEIAKVEVFYKALGLLEPDADLLEELRAIYSAGVLGFYDPETDELVVRGTELTPYVRQTVVHELVHALDDQHFELDRDEYDDRKDEISLGFTSVVEGNARRIEQEWLDEQPEEVQEQAQAEEREFADGIDVRTFPEILLFEIGAPYELGRIFVDAIVGEGGQRAVDAALQDPPTTSEQVLFPPLYRERHPRVEVPPPPADGDVVDDGVVGTLFWFGLFTTGDTTVAPQDAFAAIEGWGGDWAVTWEAGGAACVRIDVVGDTVEDTDELEDALRTWAEGSVAAEVSMVDERVRLDSCVAGAGAVPPQV